MRLKPSFLNILKRFEYKFIFSDEKTEEPIRSEIFSAERLKQHAESLALTQTVTSNPKKGYNLAERLKNNRKIFSDCYHTIGGAVSEKQTITPAAEWLIDNFHIVEGQLRDISEHLPIGFYKELPKLSEGPLKGYPRVYGLSWAFVAHTDSRFDPELLTQFVKAYQNVQPLTIGEIWAIAITLRIVLVENLRRLSVRILSSMQARKNADLLADELLGLSTGNIPQTLEIYLKGFEGRQLRKSFLVHLIQRLRYHDPTVTSTMQWVHKKLAEMNLTTDEIVSLEHNNQSAANVTVRNIITSMRLISAFDWRTFFESISLVDDTLKKDPVFAAMDFTSQDRYRHAIEELNRGSKYSELDIAKLVVLKTEKYKAEQQSAGKPIEEKHTHPGYCLISAGRKTLEKEIKFSPSIGSKILDFYISNAKVGYISTILLLAGVVLFVPLYLSYLDGVSLFGLLILSMVGFFPASDIAVALLNKIVAKFAKPAYLPRLKLSHGIPASMQTFVVMPILLIDKETIEEHLEQLEVHYLSNPDGAVHFALLSDWKDSMTECCLEDEGLFNIANKGIEQLNSTHGALANGQKRFFLFHRKRMWNQGENKWMGWERKRGKLHEFNRLLRGASDTTYISVDSKIPKDTKYVITLDADTRMPMGMVNQLVGTMAHPLNKPTFDPHLRRVIEGYGIMQPRIMPSLPSRTNSSLFQRLFSGPCGIDPYTFAVSDTYQDLFGEGTYAGKGIYDVDIFEAALKDRVPENALLSHDLFEGIFARCGFISDLEFFDDFPSHTEASSSRTDRWARGDWQLLPWICGDKSKPIPCIGRWKMLDNLRRTLSAPGMLFTLIASWFLPRTPHILWTGFVILALAFPLFLPFISGLIPDTRKRKKISRFRILLHDFLTGFQQTIILFSLLMSNAVLMLDSIIRTLYRLFISKRNLLKWVTVAQEKTSSNLSLKYFFNKHRTALFCSVVLGIMFLLLKSDGVALFAGSFILLWMMSPVVAWYISQPPTTDPVEPPTQEGIKLFRLIARRTWRFFTAFITKDNSLLPPDNFQEDPQPVVAHRSSPTNFGLYLLSVVSAKDFGWIGIGEMVDRLESTLLVLDDLPRFKGHFYNWYDLKTKQALLPQYISSVDSGNLAGHLLVISQTCKETLQNPLPTLNRIVGIQDAIFLLQESLLKIDEKRRTFTVNLDHLQMAINDIEQLLKDFPQTPCEYFSRWESLLISANVLTDIAKTFSQEHGESDCSEMLFWSLQIFSDIKSHLSDYEQILPWAKLLDKNNLPLDISDEEKEQITLLLKDEILKLSLSDLCVYYEDIVKKLISLQTKYSYNISSNTRSYIDTLIYVIEKSSFACKILMNKLIEISMISDRLFDEMDFKFLFDSNRNLFSIGFNISDGHLDPSYYDMLASEARLTSFIAITKGDVPTKHWFSLSRALTSVANGSALLSWSGSMFEYLMPSLVMYTPRGSLLDRTCRLIIKKQIQYGTEHQIPWGISESAYNIRDRYFTYQYSGFGVPALGLKRGLGEDLVISPYSTALAAMYSPRLAEENFKRLEEIGALGSYGFYEALDFTTERLPENEKVAIIRAYMAHHQGMTLVALTNVVFDGIMRHRFHNVSIVRAAELLLQERTPRNVAIAYARTENLQVSVRDASLSALRRFDLPNLPIPSTHLLSNGHYTVMLTSAGSGYSRWNDLSITRWREDSTCDMWGSYIFLYDTESNKSWSAGFQPSGTKPDHYEVTFAEDRANIVRHDGDIITHLEVIVSSEDNAEIRRVSLKNTGMKAKEIEVTSYSEIVLAPQGADVMHPAFSNLFVQTEYVSEVTGLIATRRPRSSNETPIWMAHVISVDGDINPGIEYETDRVRFLGRGCSIRKAVSVVEGQPLSNTVGAVLDPVASLRTRIQIPPGATKHITFSTVVANSREEIIDLADKYHDPSIFHRISTLAWTHAQVQLHYLGIDSMEANFFQHLANRIIYSNPSMRPSSEILKRNTLNISGLWPHQISGDHPILMVHIDSIDDQAVIRQLLRAHEYWKMKRLVVDLVIINEKATSYIQDLQILLEAMVRTSLQMSGNYSQESRGSIFVLRADMLTLQEKELLQTVARSVMSCKEGSLAEQIKRMKRSSYKPIYQANNKFINDSTDEDLPAVYPSLEFFNGLGGFAEDGYEYAIILGKLQYTPAPWINVIANSEIGFLVSESGSGYTWSLNSRENQLTPWSNDPVCDPASEVFYICDEETGQLWTPTALPIRIENANYITRHGQGYSIFEHSSHGIESKLTQYVSWDDPIKISHLILENKSERTRNLSVTAYLEWVLGSSRSSSAPFIITEVDEETNAMFVSNPLNTEFGRRIAFVDFCGKQISWTADRTEFIGRNGTLQQPASLVHGEELSENVGAGLDPCSAQQVVIEIPPKGKVELSFFLGQVKDRETARNLIKKYRSVSPESVLKNVKENWENILGKIQVKTPDRKTDIMLNRWLLYQTLVCRYWARTAFYQAGGAYGFRDQLQDVMALVLSQPSLARAHILNAASHQFLEGDVQHWWHPPLDRGVRTHCSDDGLWLPYVVHHYIRVTGDSTILDEIVPFLEGRLLLPEEESAYYQPIRSEHNATVIEHCKRVLDRSLKVGVHGLPLIGSCDWNDGMNRVGHEGLGESIWLGWFLYSTLTQFATIAKNRNENDCVERWLNHAKGLKIALEKEAWDGAWYKRAYFDDGTPLGSALNSECRIDSIAQSWSVISKAADTNRAIKAMESVEKYLVRQGDNLILLFTPPFDKTPHDPGYIKGYLPGIRENGGQYVHAAIWSVIAFAMLGNGNKAYEFFSMLNPINHTDTRAGVHRYKVEPYVIAADVYSEPPHVGRGGWTWYTGSAGWMYRAGTEWILGLRVEENILHINPCIPSHWQNFMISYRHGQAQYEILVENPNCVTGGVKTLELDNKPITPIESGIPLIDDMKVHIVKVLLG